MKSIHPNMDNCTYTCASCKATFEILSSKPGSVSIDVCSLCHPFYIGKSNGVSLRGRAEKLASKFEAGKQNTKTKPTTKTKEKTTKSNKVVKGFESL